MSRTKLIGLLATLVVLLIVLVAGTALYTSVRYVEEEETARAAIKSSNDYAVALDRLKDAILDVETGQRGYLLTGNRDYLEPYLAVRDSIDAAKPSAWALAAFRGGEDTELRKLVEFKLTELDETIRLFDSGNPGASLAIVQTNRGKDYMQDIRAAIAARQAESKVIGNDAAAEIIAYGERTDLLSTLLAALLALAAIMGAVTIYLWLRTDQAVTEAEEATDSAARIEVIARELNHRMKNMFAVAQGMLRQSARGRGDDVLAYAEQATARLTAMSQAYAVTRDLDATLTLSTHELIDKVVRVQMMEAHRVKVQGMPWKLTENAITPLALILHEWTTNALKYGAWKLDDTRRGNAEVTIILSEDDDGVNTLVWDEHCDRKGQETPEGSGYGSKLIKACASQLGGTVEYNWHDDGVVITLRVDRDFLAS